ncbi:MAG: hypothetical protein HY075_08435, partial [Deltaproteobacteria bacterium]|nr:hypothetical protein [Deltaproteobacteria bacterium]
DTAATHAERRQLLEERLVRCVNRRLAATGASKVFFLVEPEDRLAAIDQKVAA